MPLPIGAGPVPEVQLVVAGRDAWIVDSDRTLGSAARYVDGHWQAWSDPPCTHADPSPQLSLAAGAGVLVAVCSHWGVEVAPSALVSTDGGAWFAARRCDYMCGRSGWRLRREQLDW